MYVYFDVNGNLKEIIQTAVREGSVNDNHIYAYVEPGTVQPVDGVYHLSSVFTNAKMNFDLVDSNQELVGSVPMTKVEEQIPANKNRDLKYFKYGYTYEFWKITLPTEVTSVSGVVSATMFIYNESVQKAMNTFSFNVEESVGIRFDSTMTQSQYSYLFNMLQRVVPYVVLGNAVDFGNYNVVAKSIIGRKPEDYIYAIYTGTEIDINSEDDGDLGKLNIRTDIINMEDTIATEKRVIRTVPETFFPADSYTRVFSTSEERDEMVDLLLDIVENTTALKFKGNEEQIKFVYRYVITSASIITDTDDHLQDIEIRYEKRNASYHLFYSENSWTLFIQKLS